MYEVQEGPNAVRVWLNGEEVAQAMRTSSGVWYATKTGGVWCGYEHERVTLSAWAARWRDAR